MARSTLLRVTVSALLAVTTAAGMSACIGGPGSSTPTATAPSPTPTTTPTPTATPTPTPTNTGVVPASPTPTPTPEPTTPPAPVITTVSVEFNNAAYQPDTGSIDVAGMVTDLVSSTGACIATASQDAQSFTAQAPGMADAAVTYCSNLSIPLPAGSTGEWTVELAFADDAHSGSTSTTVQVG